MSSYVCSIYDAESNQFISLLTHSRKLSRGQKNVHEKSKDMQICSQNKKARIEQITSKRELRCNRLSKDAIAMKNRTYIATEQKVRTSIQQGFHGQRQKYACMDVGRSILYFYYPMSITQKKHCLCGIFFTIMVI